MTKLDKIKQLFSGEINNTRVLVLKPLMEFLLKSNLIKSDSMKLYFIESVYSSSLLELIKLSIPTIFSISGKLIESFVKED